MPAVGKAISWVMVIDELAVQPFKAVAVTVYVPTAVMVTFELVPKPPLQLYVFPPVAVKLMLVCVQVSTVVPLLFVMPADGIVGSEVIAILEVAVHPVAPVTVTVYVPAEVTVVFALAPKPPLQLYVPPPVAVTLTVV
jgi:hypothetical protein